MPRINFENLVLNLFVEMFLRKKFYYEFVSQLIFQSCHELTDLSRFFNGERSVTS